jgi:hypothetical protein
MIDYISCNHIIHIHIHFEDILPAFQDYDITIYTWREILQQFLIATERTNVSLR